VLVRGFGLTAIDVILTLTEGRGGQFVPASSIPTYINGPDQPRFIDVHSRSGRPMLAKPTAAVEPITDEFWTPYRHRLQQQQINHGSLHFHRDIWSVIIDAAASLLDQVGGDIDEWYRGWSGCKVDRNVAHKVMRDSYEIALGKRPKNIAFALGEAWRKLYP
jgi:diaminopimelate decarboxylase